MKSLSSSLPMLALCLLAGACSTTQPPPAPALLPPAPLMAPPPPLRLLPGTGEVSPRVAAEVVAENYGLYHQLAAQLRALQGWVLGVSK